MDLINRDLTAALTLFLLDLAIKGAVLVLCVAGVTMLLRRSSAALRSLIWNAAVTALLALPLLAVAGPGMKVPFLPDIIGGKAGAGKTAEVIPAAPDPGRMAPVDLSGRGSGPLIAPSLNRLRLPRLPWHTWTALLWAAGLLLVAARYAAGRWTLGRLRGSCRACSRDDLTDLLAQISRQVGLRRPVEIIISAHTPVAFTSGLRRPAVVLPPEAGEWTARALRSVLVHELAHIRRRDVLFETLSQAAVTLFWYNPAVWFAVRHLRIERERACDDAVLAGGSRPSEYAGQLLELAGTPGVVRCPFWRSTALSQGGSLKERLLFILDPARRRSGQGRFAAPAVVVACTLLTLPLALVVPWKTSGDIPTLLRAELTGIFTVRAKLGEMLSDAGSPDPSVRAAAAEALGGVEGRRARETLELLVGDHDPAVRREAVQALGQRKDPANVPLFFTIILEDYSGPVLAEAVTWLVKGYTGSDRVIAAAFRAELDRVGWEGGWSAVMKAASQAGFEDRLSMGRRIAGTVLEEPDEGFRTAAVEAVTEFPDRALIEADLLLMTDEFVKIRAAATRALGMIGDTGKDVQNALNETAFKDEHPYARIAAVEALGMLGTDNARFVCEQLSRDDADAEVRQAARKVLQTLDGRGR